MAPSNKGLSERPLSFNVTELSFSFFFVADYFKNITSLPKIPFLNEVVISFGISNSKEHYHVPLLVSPWSYSTYRGS